MISQLKETAQFLESKINGFKPTTGVILGTGLGSLIHDVEVEYSFSYEDLPNFPISTVEEHAGKLIFGKLSGEPVVVMQGRFHFYEGYSMQEVAFPVRVMKLLGVQDLLVSNAAGGINPQFQAADMMIINDHISLLPDNPLLGKNLDELGPRWPDMYESYNKDLIQKALRYSESKDYRAFEGVYVSVPGPNLETPAEYKYLSIIGADAVGMSTVPEIIAARHMGMRCLAVSVITDLCYPEALKACKIEEILKAAANAEPRLTDLFKYIISVK